MAIRVVRDKQSYFYYVEGTGLLVDDVKDLYGEGKSEEEIADRFGVTLEQVKAALWFASPDRN